MNTQQQGRLRALSGYRVFRKAYEPLAAMEAERDFTARQIANQLLRYPDEAVWPQDLAEFAAASDYVDMLRRGRTRAIRRRAYEADELHDEIAEARAS